MVIPSVYRYTRSQLPSFRPLLGVEDTVDVKQWRTNGQKNEKNNENNRFVRRCFIVMCPVSSTPRRSQFSLHLEASVP